LAKRAKRKVDSEQISLAEAIRRRFAPFGGVELEPAPPPIEFPDDPEEGA